MTSSCGVVVVVVAVVVVAVIVVVVVEVVEIVVVVVAVVVVVVVGGVIVARPVNGSCIRIMEVFHASVARDRMKDHLYGRLAATSAVYCRCGWFRHIFKKTTQQHELLASGPHVTPGVHACMYVHTTCALFLLTSLGAGIRQRAAQHMAS